MILTYHQFEMYLLKTEQKQKLLAHFPLHLKKVSHLKKYTKECVTLRQNKPKWAKRLRSLRKKYTALKKVHHRRCCGAEKYELCGEDIFASCHSSINSW